MIFLKVKEILDSRKQTMYWLSKKTDISPNNISNLYYNRTKSMNFETLERIYLALGCKSFDELFEYISEDEEQAEDKPVT